MTAAKKQLVDLKLLKTLVPLSELDDQRLMRVQEHVVIEHIEAGTQLFAKGERDGLTYFLLSGQVQLTFVSGLEKIVNADSGIACRALAPEQPRTATAIATTPISLLSVETALLNELQDWGHDGYQVQNIEGEGNNDSDWMTLFLQSKVFLKLPAQNIQALMMRMEEITVRAGKVIIRQGDDDGYYFIIKRGNARVTRRFTPQDDEVEVAVLGPGSGFGEEAILTHNRRGATVTMSQSGSLMRLSRNDFNRLLVEPLIQEIDYQEAIENKNHMFLDVRSYDDYIDDGIEGSLNISVAELRPKIATLESSKQYVVCSNTGSRAAAAAFLLCQQGMDAVVLKHGLQGLPDEVKRGNLSAPRGDEIPLVDNVVSFTRSTGVEPPPPGVNAPLNAEQAMKDPRVQSLFSRAKRRVQHESQRAQQAEEARLKAESEVERLKAEAEKARMEAEEAQRQVEMAAQQSAEAARLQTKKEAARLRELELGAKQAEMEEAVHQAEQEAQRAHDAEVARKMAEEEIERIKAEMQQALQQAQEEAKKSTEAMRQFLEHQARQEKQAAERKAEQEAQRARQAEAEIARLRAEAEATKQKLEQQAKLAADQARNAAQQESEQALHRAEENARRAQAAEQARLQAEAETQRLRKEADQARIVAELQAQQMAEVARTKAEQEAVRARAEEMARSQHEAEQILRRAEEETARAQAAEQSRLQAEAEIQRLRDEAESARLTVDAVRIAAEQENARIRAEATAKQQYDIERAAQKAAAEARRQAEQEIALIKLQAAQERQLLEAQASRDAQSARAEAELLAQQKANDEARRSQEAESARQNAEQEIARLKAEAEAARQQIQQQLSVEVARSEIEHEVARVRAEELANKQWEIEEMARKAEEESSRARAAEEAYQHAEAEIQRLKAEAEATRVQIVHTQDNNSNADSTQLSDALNQKQHEIEIVMRHAREEAERAQAAEQARQQAQFEIDRLREEMAVATLQANAQLQRDAERAAAEEEAVKQRAAELSLKEREIQYAIEKAELESKRAQEAEQARLTAEAEIRQLRATVEAHEEAQHEIQRLKAQAGMAYAKAQEKVKADVAAAEQRAKQEVLQAARSAAAEKRRAETAERARQKAERELARVKQAAEAERLKSQQTVRNTIKQAKRELDEKRRLRKLASEKARRAMEQQLDATQASVNHTQLNHSSLNNEDFQRTRPMPRPAPAQRAHKNTVEDLPLVDIMPNVLPEEPVIDLDNIYAHSEADSKPWVSDSVMWEATLGMREDEVVERLISPESDRHSSVAVNPEPSPMVPPVEAARFIAREINPYVDTQQLDGVFRPGARGWMRKAVIALLGVVVLASGAYYFSMGQAERTHLQSKMHEVISKDGNIDNISSKVKAEISQLSQSTKARISSTTTATERRAAAAAKRESAEALDKVITTNSMSGAQQDAEQSQEEQKPLSLEERVKMKVEQKERAQRALMQRRREYEIAREQQHRKRVSHKHASKASHKQLQPVLVAPNTTAQTNSQNGAPVKITVISRPGQKSQSTLKPVQLVDPAAASE